MMGITNATLDPKESTEQLISIGDVAKLIGVPTHTIRYWEKEFPAYIVPPRTLGKQRRYGSIQIEQLQRIHSMLKKDGYSIAGAKRALAHENRQARLPSLEETGMDPQLAEKMIAVLKTHFIKTT